MVRFLINKPIAVSMTFLALLTLGIIAIFRIPVSLVPEIDIPKITVHVRAKNLSARELENAVVSQFRMQLVQVAHLADIRSETRDGSAVINLEFDYGTNIDYAFIEVNEKIDRSMPGLPENVERPKVIKASAADIPVFFLNLTMKENDSVKTKDELFPVSKAFLDMSNFAGQVIRKRIEQLPQVAIADISGQVFQEILIIPDLKKLDALNIPLTQIEAALQENNISLGNLLIQDGQYQYSVQFGNEIKTAQDIADIYIKKDDRLFQLKDFATIVQHPQKQNGLVRSDGRNAITMAIIKQSDVRMSDLKKELKHLIEVFKTDYPNIEFTITRDQTQLLNFSIRNLSQSLYLGAFLAIIVMFLFLKNYKSPWLIGIALPAALVISLLFFQVVGLSLNVVSLAGLVLGISIMTDNSIVVIDNISQHQDRGNDLEISCINGTNEVFVPMLSSVLTTCAVYIPLIFVGGIAGALFYDQAIAITISQFVSLFIGITVLPVYYKLMFKNGKSGEMKGVLKSVNDFDYGKLYEKGFKWVMRNQVLSIAAIFFMLVGALVLFLLLEKTKLPLISKDETVLRIDWNLPVNIKENDKRVQRIISNTKNKVMHYSSIIGEQQFMLDHNSPKSSSEVLLYLKVQSPEDLDSVIKTVGSQLNALYPTASFSFEDAGNIFDQLFGEHQPPLMIRLRATNDFGTSGNEYLREAISELKDSIPTIVINDMIWQEQTILKADASLLALYGVTYEQLLSVLKRAFRENELFVITDNQNFIPVILGDRPRYLHEIIADVTIRKKDGVEIPISNFLKESTEADLKTIIAGQEGEYFPITMDVQNNDVQGIQAKVRNILSLKGRYEASFSGSIFSNRILLRQLTLIFIISLALLYFILASQFESLSLPLIVLLEIPVDLFGAFLFLKMFGEGINLMSMIGIVVMSGVVINDSILKVDTFNQLMKEGKPLLKALMLGGQRRLKPIVMTALTCILALLPLLFFGGMGADLQKPMALVIIGGMIVGTLVSLYIVPLAYYYLKRRTANSTMND